MSSSSCPVAWEQVPLWTALLQGSVSYFMRLPSLCCQCCLQWDLRVSLWAFSILSPCVVCKAWSLPSSRICQCKVSLKVLSERSYSSDRDASLTQQSMTLILQFLASWGHRHRQCISTCEPQRWCPSCTGSSRCTKYQRRTLAQAAFQRAILAREGTSQAVHLWEHPHRGS